MLFSPAPSARCSASLAVLADRCVQCGLCLPHCPTYQLDATEAESPRGRIAYMKALATGQIEASAAGNLHLDHCLGCRRCESACPSGVDYGTLLLQTRAIQFTQRTRPWRECWRLELLARPRVLGVLLRVYRYLHPLLPRAWRPLPRPTVSGVITRNQGLEEVALFVGCIADTYESTSRAALNRLLVAVGVQAVIPTGQTCCGTAALHAGNTAQAAALSSQNRAAFFGHNKILSLASGCQETLANSLEGVSQVQDALSFLEPHADRLRFRSAQGRRVAVHLPCSQRNVTKTGTALLRLLARVPDLELIELPDTGCCGSAGLHSVSEPERAGKLRQPLIDALHQSGASELLSANLGCRHHLANGTHLPVRHPIDFLAEHLA